MIDAIPIFSHLFDLPIKLLDELIGVIKSPWPQLKLLSVLCLSATPKQSPKTIALAAPILEISTSIKELEKQAITPKPVMKTAVKPEIKKPVEKKIDAPASPFDWNTLIEHTRKNYVAIYSVLSKCSYDIDGEILNIYTNSAFYKKKLDDIKYSPLLNKSLQDLGFYNLEINTIPTAIPPKDSQAAMIADIMGGGEEVSVEI